MAKTLPIRQISTPHVTQNIAGRFSIRKIEDLFKGADLTHHLHKHDFFFLLFIQKGKGVHEIDFKQYEIRPNSVFILRPGQVHRLELKRGTVGFLVEFDPAFYPPKNSALTHQWRKAIARNYCPNIGKAFIKLQGTLQDIYGEFINQKDNYTVAIMAYLDLFFIEYARQSSNPKSIAGTGGNYVQERFDEITASIEKNVTGMKSISDYAKLLNLSPYQLNAITKSSVGKTVSDLINEQIILEAKRFLLATPMQVKDIADYLGYGDISYFIRFFKKHTSHSPEVFRKKFK